MTKMPDKKIPLRQCIACRELKEKRDMLRIVKNSEGRVFVDFSYKAAGRGAYVCANPDCLKKLKKGKLLNKVFSCAVDDAVYAAVEEECVGKKQN